MTQNSVRVRRSVPTSDEAVAKSSLVETAGYVGDGVVTELVRDGSTGELGLMKITAEGDETVKQFSHDGVVFVAPQNPNAMMRALVLPSKMHATPVKARDICREILSVCGDLVDEAGGYLLSTIILATWAIDWLSHAPALAVIGSRGQSLELLKAIACMCRRSLLLGDLNQTAFRLLPFEMHPTLVLGSVDRAVHRALSTSGVRGLPMLLRDRLVEPFCVSIIHVQSPYMPPRGEDRYRISVRPDAIALPRTGRQLKDLAARFQPMLLRFRADLGLKGAGREQETTGLAGQVRAQELVSVLFGDDAETRDRVLSLLLAQEDGLQRSQLSGVPALVVEALLAIVHQQKIVVTVGEVAKDANAILQGRGENYGLEARAIGSVLDELGLEREDRHSQGFRLRLSQEAGRYVHELARTYRVPNRKPGCRLCEEVFGNLPE